MFQIHFRSVCSYHLLTILVHVQNTLQERVFLTPVNHNCTVDVPNNSGACVPVPATPVTLSPVGRVQPPTLPQNQAWAQLSYHFLAQVLKLWHSRTATAIPFIYSFSGNCAASAPISTFMCLWAMYIPRIGPHISPSRKGRPIVGIYNALTDTWM